MRNTLKELFLIKGANFVSSHNRPFHSFFNFRHGQVRKKFVDTTGGSALILATLPNLKVICIEASKDLAPQSCENLQTFVWWRQVCAPTMQTSVKFCDFEELNLLSLSQ